MNQWQRWVLGGALLTTSLLVAGCAQSPAAQAPEFELTVAHINDHHSNLLPHQSTALQVEGKEYSIETGGFARVVTQINAIRAAQPNVLALHAGDAITGTLFYTVYNGAADAALMNEVCFDAFALGNHEFDNGDAGLKSFLDALAMTANCRTEVLAANVQPQVGKSPLTPKTRWDSFKPYAIFQLAGEKVGIIGLDIAIKTKNSSQPDASTRFADELATAKFYIAELQRQGIEKIGLLTHIQLQNDLRIAEQLPGVDFIVGGDSHTLMGDFAGYGLPTVGPYPMQVTNLDGDPVCVAQAWQYSQVVGELRVAFNGDLVAACGGQAHVLVAENAPQAIKTLPQFTAVAENPAAKELLTGYQASLDELTETVVADVKARLCMKRMGPTTVPGCGIGRQSDAHAVVAKAFLASSPQADFALQNAGGVRADINAGPFTIADAYRLLPFANTLVEVQITGAELKQVLEQALSYALSDTGSDGGYPHGAGIRFDVDLQAKDGQRISQLQVRRGQGWQALDPAQTYTMITNSFLASGADGWRLLSKLKADGRVQDTYINYAQSFVDWASKTKTIKRPTEHSTQSYRSLDE
ncbi:5'-nucleotidase C-terminal domain-containing protein [Pseudidiomarina sp. 1APP75-32.1]|uniref:5'-nucleotidase C-terminal domain-containing protein n=1 Tax=Pseudidiomarina terrestris TaxID=2820060 RepID=A0AAW7QWV8_9GAMM|nr:5'-nucleotidase C-terminal domain-containing protein [Pseudidiomarina sp. 1APP75-32.1]MDN7123942.1 5'-nucleotidase C-terminal domain-containing protein [Pseudidiomarina sp. 1APP75-32.1]